MPDIRIQAPSMSAVQTGLGEYVHMLSRKSILLSCVFALTALSASEAFAQATEIEELVVTAEKREQSLQDVPVAISAIVPFSRRPGSAVSVSIVL